VLQRFRAKYPQVEFSVRALDTDQVPALVRSRDVDLSFLAVGQRSILNGLEVIPFAHDVLVAVCSKRSDLATRRSVTLESISEEEFVDLVAKRALRVMLDHVFRERGLKRPSTYEVSDVETLLQFVSCGLGIAIVPESLVRSSRYANQLHVLAIKKEGLAMPKWRIAIVTRAQRRPLQGKTIVQLFLETLSEVQKIEGDAR
jgi:DNA-binding transcriptional LysR family regulator